MACRECGSPTSKGKPLCAEHVELEPRVAEMLRGLALLQAAEDAAIAGRVVQLDSPLALEVQGFVGVVGVAPLLEVAARLELDPAAVAGAARTLSDARSIWAIQAQDGSVILGAPDVERPPGARLARLGPVRPKAARPPASWGRGKRAEWRPGLREALQELRRTRGTRALMAEIGCSKPSLVQWTRGYNAPSPYWQDRIAAVVGPG